MAIKIGYFERRTQTFACTSVISTAPCHICENFGRARRTSAAQILSPSERVSCLDQKYRGRPTTNSPQSFSFLTQRTMNAMEDVNGKAAFNFTGAT